MRFNSLQISLLAAVIVAGCATNPLGQKDTGKQLAPAVQKTVSSMVMAPDGKAKRHKVLYVPSDECLVNYDFYVYGNGTCVPNGVDCATGEQIRLASGPTVGFSVGELDFFETITLSEISAVSFLSDMTQRPSAGWTRLTFALDLEGDGYSTTDPLDFLSSNAGTGADAIPEDTCGTVSTGTITAFSFNDAISNPFTGTFAQAQAAFPNAVVVAVAVVVDGPPQSEPTDPITEQFIDNFLVTFTDPTRAPILIDECADIAPLPE